MGDTPYAQIPAEERRKRAEHFSRSGSTDHDRWADVRNLSSKWDSRAQIVAGLIDPPVRVIDLGCGAMALEGELEDGVTYFPADLVARDCRTQIFDLNGGDLPDLDADVPVALGLLEYAHDPSRFFQQAASRWPRLILTYHPVDVRGASADRIAKGWFNALTTDELLALASSAGFELRDLKAMSTDRIFDFCRSA